jgi:hypothetical protein
MTISKDIQAYIMRYLRLIVPPFSKDQGIEVEGAWLSHGQAYILVQSTFLQQAMLSSNPLYKELMSVNPKPIALSNSVSHRALS